MLITIYDKVGNPKVELSPNDSSTQAAEIQGDSVLTLSFTHYEHIDLDVDDYADFEGERYWLTEKYRPKQKSTKEWSYDIKLYGVESMIKRLLVIKTVDDEEEPVFTLTAPPREHVAMIVRCMNDGMGNISDWKVGQVDGTENIVIDYFGKYCDQALKEIAGKVGAEWWVEGQTVNICKCEHGEPVPMGYDKGLTGIEPTTADNVDFYTRLYPVGSSRNIDREKYGYTRLQLPGGQRYVEMNADKYGRVDHYEADAFAYIYPRRVGVVSSVRSEVKTGEDGKPFTIYYFSDDSLPFNPNDYEIGGLVKRVSFQEGSELAGLGDEEDGTYYFEVNYNSDTREFEIITIWPYDDGTQLPGGTLVPKAGDKYILWNLRMPDEYYALAEEEFLAAVNKYNADHNLDLTVFKASTDHVWIEDNGVELSIGRRVRLESEEYFPELGYRDSRITRITRKVNLPSQMDIEIGDALSRTSMQRMSDSVSDAKSYARSIGKSLALPDIVRRGDRTRLTDNNLLSALRCVDEFLSRLKDDRSKGKIASDIGFEIGNYLAGVSGGIFGIDKSTGDSFAEVSRLFVRCRAYFETLTIIEAAALAGKQYITPGGSIKCTNVEEITDASGALAAYRCYFLSEQDGERTECKFIAGDQAISEMFNAKEGVTNKVSNHRYWRLVIGVNNDALTDDSGNRYGYIDLSATDCESGSDAPREGDVIEQFGNRADRTRQAAMVFSTVDPDSPSIKLLTGIGSGDTLAEHYSLAGKDIVSLGYDPVKGHACFKCYGDTYIGAPDESTFVKYDHDKKRLGIKADIHVGSTIGGKSIDQYFADKATDAVDNYKYLADALMQDTHIAGGLIMSTLISLGYTDAASVRHAMAGMNGSWVDSLGGRTIASWWGGPMVDLFDDTDVKKNLLAGSHATSLVRMDGSVYFAGGNVGFRADGSAWFGTGDTAITIANGSVKLGNGILIDIGGEAKGLGDSIASLTTVLNALQTVLVPENDSGVRVAWNQATRVRSTLNFYSEHDISAFGGRFGAGSGAGNTGIDEESLAAYLTEHSYATQTWVASRGFLTTGSLSAYLTKTDAASLYQPKGNYLTSSALAEYMKTAEADAKYVTRTGAQTISGAKTFTVQQTIAVDGTALAVRSVSDANNMRVALLSQANWGEVRIYGKGGHFTGMRTDANAQQLWITKGYGTDWSWDVTVKAGDFQAMGGRFWFDEAKTASMWWNTSGYVQLNKALVCSGDIVAFSDGTSLPGSSPVIGIDEETLAAYLTEHNYATQTWVASRGFLTAGSLSAYLKATDAASLYQPKGNYLTPSALDGYVTLVTAQTISGAKTFTADIAATGRAIITKQLDGITNFWASEHGQFFMRTASTRQYHSLGLGIFNGAGHIQASQHNVGGVPLLLNPKGGNVGVGMSNPAYLLDVYGQFRAHGLNVIDNAGIQWADGTVLWYDANSTCIRVNKPLTSSGVVRAEWFAANAQNLCANLNADLLDGKHLADILNSNVASATKWQTARRFWGQLADGTDDVSGDMSGVGNIAASGRVTAAFDPTGYSNFWASEHGQLLVKTGTAAGFYSFGIGVRSADGVAQLQASQNGVGGIKLLLNPKGGNVGIGNTTNPKYPLDVHGQARANGLISESFDALRLSTASGDLRMRVCASDNWASMRMYGNAGRYVEMRPNAGGTQLTLASCLSDSDYTFDVSLLTGSVVLRGGRLYLDEAKTAYIYYDTAAGCVRTNKPFIGANDITAFKS